MATPPKKFTVVRRARDEASTLPSTAHPMQQAFVEAAQRVAAVLNGGSLSASESQTPVTDGFRRDVHDLVYGTLRNFGEGDAILRRLMERDPDTLIRALLLVVIYRLGKRPDSEHVVVDQAVDAAGVLSQRKAGGFVNAILRNYLRQRTALLKAIATAPELAFQHPLWWVERLERAWPDDWKKILDVGNAPPPVSLRVNTLRINRSDYLEQLREAGVNASALDGFSSAIRLPEGARIDALPGYAEGDFAVQDPGAQRAAEWLDVRDGQRVLDACAAPGGKSGHVLELANVDLLALDLDPLRCRRIEANLARLKHQAKIIVGDAGQPDAWWDGQMFDRILADVPCTASGVVRRHPDVKWLRRDEDVASFARTQAALLKALWPLLKPGGKLLYATCSVFPEENHLQVSAFNATFPEARLLKQEQLLPSPIHDGFYYALLEKPLA